MHLRILLATAVVLPLFGDSVSRAGEPEQWFSQGHLTLLRLKHYAAVTRPARNVILFVGDGMGISTVTAARILAGQLRGKTGEENLLTFERLPYTALIKTYSTNEQVPDSAGTMSAIVTGVKTRSGVLSVDENLDIGDFASTAAHSLTTIFELAERSGRLTGIVTTTRVTHATPAACYAHVPGRTWEDDSTMPAAALAAKFPDIARQLIEFAEGDGFDVVLGGGRLNFLPVTVADPEEPNLTGRRRDGRDLTKEWSDRPDAVYVWNTKQLDEVDVAKTRHLLGLFSPSHMAFEHDRAKDKAGEPSLSEMTAKAIEVLEKRDEGFVLLVEGGRIDHAHHVANAYRALTDTIEFDKAVRVALDKTNRRDTLIIVTADHSHVFTIGGYPTRGNPILGKVIQNDRLGHPETTFAKDSLGLPYTTLGYANGPGYTGASADQPEGPKHVPHSGRDYKGITNGRPDLTSIDTADPGYLQECATPLSVETHGGEDVPLYAGGPHAHLFHGVLEQNVIFHVMVEALRLQAKPPPKATP